MAGNGGSHIVCAVSLLVAGRFGRGSQTSGSDTVYDQFVPDRQRPAWVNSLSGAGPSTIGSGRVGSLFAAGPSIPESHIPGQVTSGSSSRFTQASIESTSCSRPWSLAPDLLKRGPATC